MESHFILNLDTFPPIITQPLPVSVISPIVFSPKKMESSPQNSVLQPLHDTVSVEALHRQWHKPLIKSHRSEEPFSRLTSTETLTLGVFPLLQGHQWLLQLNPILHLSLKSGLPGVRETLWFPINSFISPQYISFQNVRDRVWSLLF